MGRPNRGLAETQCVANRENPAKKMQNLFGCDLNGG
jgi:hypothetical protein